LPVRRLGLSCTARASRPAVAVGVSSNVMPHQTPFTPAANRSSLQRQHTKYKWPSPVQFTWGSCAASPSRLVGAACQKTELLIAATEEFIVKISASLRTRPQKAQDTGSAQQITRPINPERLLKLQAQAAGARRASLSEPLARGMFRSGGVPPLLCRQPRRGGFRSPPAEVANFPCACTVRHNPSLSPRPATAGRLARAARWFMLHRAGKPSCLRGRG
jgi:hypothetical protein